MIRFPEFVTMSTTFGIREVTMISPNEIGRKQRMYVNPLTKKTAFYEETNFLEAGRHVSKDKRKALCRFTRQDGITKSGKHSMIEPLPLKTENCQKTSEEIF